MNSESGESDILMILAHTLLSIVQSRILLVLLVDEGLGTSALLHTVGISGKTWSKEREKLEGLGLLSSVNERRFTEKGIRPMKYHYLTRKGCTIAVSVREISFAVDRK